MTLEDAKKFNRELGRHAIGEGRGDNFLLFPGDKKKERWLP